MVTGISTMRPSGERAAESGIEVGGKRGRNAGIEVAISGQVRAPYLPLRSILVVLNNETEVSYIGWELSLGLSCTGTDAETDSFVAEKTSRLLCPILQSTPLRPYGNF